MSDEMIKQIINAGEIIGKKAPNSTKIAFNLLDANCSKDVACIFLESCCKNNIIIQNKFITEMMNDNIEYKDVAQYLAFGIAKKKA